jgi:tetratricopeptide (TPR) repeat protein
MTTDPDGALKDFEAAIALDPQCRSALQNKAHVLSEKLGRTEASIDVLSRLMRLHPDFAHARASRGVLLARLGKRDEAIRDGEEILKRDDSPRIRYQVGSLYAVTSRVEPADRERALELIRSAIKDGYGWDYLLTDTDLDPIRDDPRLREMVRFAKSLADVE